MPGYVYILTNDRHTVIYTGVTANLLKRMEAHRSRKVRGFTRRYNVHKLVYVEEYETIVDAIAREKQIKAGSRRRKLALIESLNPEWWDLILEP